MRKMKHFLLTFNLVMLAVVFFSMSLASAIADNISHAYFGPTDAPSGSLVSLEESKSDTVVLADKSNGAKLVGVATAGKESLIAINGSNTKVQVVSSGTANVLVTSINGFIGVGDQISVSPFSGFGMKAEPGSHIIGTAQSALTATTPGVTKQSVTGKAGWTQEVTVGLVKVNIAVGVDNVASTTAKLTGLQKIVRSTTGHTISTLRIIAAISILIVASIALITLIYASIFGSIISIGRNPLAKFAILRSLILVVAMAALISIIAGSTVFFLLS